MFIDRLLNQDTMPLMEQVVRFSAERQKLLAENVANISVPGYAQKDLSVEKFQEMLRDRIDERSRAPLGTVGFDDIMGDVTNPARNILFHDGNNRSIEQLMGDGAKNAMYHNMMIELLRKQIGQLDMAIRERVG